MRYVYKLENLVNHKVYVGQAKDPANRKAGHFYAARKGNQRPLYRSIRKHGVENFLFEVIEECADELINEREQHWVTHFDSFNPEKGYNLTSGGNQYFSVSEETKQKISVSCKLIMQKLWNDPTYRQCHAKRSSQRLKKLLLEGKLKRCDWTGRHHSEESKTKIGLANSRHQRGSGNSQFGKVWIFNPKTQFVKKEDLDAFLLQGWNKGRK